MERRWWSAALVLALLSGCGPFSGTSRRPGGGDPFVWRVNVKGAPPSYLLGTIHAGISLDDWLPGPYMATFLGARMVLTEADSDYLRARSYVRRFMWLPKGETLSARLPAGTFERLKARLVPEMPLERLERLRPWAAARAIGELRFRRMVVWIDRPPGVTPPPPPGRPPKSMDLDLTDRAEEWAMEIGALASPAAHATVLDGVPDAIWAAAIDRAIDHWEAPTAEERALPKVLRMADERFLEVTVIPPKKLAADPEYYEVMLFRRNELWMPVIEPQLAKGAAFIAAGLAHFVGERSVVWLLRGKGYDVHRLSRDEAVAVARAVKPTLEARRAEAAKRHAARRRGGYSPESDEAEGLEPESSPESAPESAPATGPS